MPNYLEINEIKSCIEHRIKSLFNGCSLQLYLAPTTFKYMYDFISYIEEHKKRNQARMRCSFEPKSLCKIDEPRPSF